MNIFNAYEVKALHLLLSGAFSDDELEALVNGCELVEYEYTGVGYFLTVKHPMLPQTRIVHHEPFVMGKAEGVVCGFVGFIENGELMLECHSLGEPVVPAEFRSRAVEIAVSPSSGQSFLF